MNTNTCLKVLHIASGDLWAGAEVQLYTLIKELYSMPGISPGIILMNHGKLEQELLNTGINVTVLDEEKLNVFQILFRLISILRKDRPDIIHTHRFKENILCSCAAYIAGNIPSLRTAHGALEHAPSWKQLPRKFILWLDWFCGRFLQKKIVSVSADLAKLLESYFPPEKIVIIENGIDLELTKNRPREHNEISSTGNRMFKIAIAGRLEPIKRVDIFIQTARYIRDNHPDITTSFHIFGDGPLLDELTQLSQETKTGDSVYFEGHCDNMPQALIEMDALLITSDHEGLPMIVLEAMALQVPVIAHAVGGIPNLLGQGSCGILVNNQSPSDYGDALYRLLTKPDIYASIRKNALERVKTDYSASKNARAYVAEYSLLAGKKRSS